MGEVAILIKLLSNEAFRCGIVPNVQHIAKMVSSGTYLHCKHAVIAIQDLCSGHKVQNSFQQWRSIKSLISLATERKQINKIVADSLGELAQCNWLNQNLVREEGGIELLFHIEAYSQLLKVLQHNNANQIFLQSKCNPAWEKVVQREAKLQNERNHLTDFEALFCPASVDEERVYQKMLDSGQWMSKLMSNKYLNEEEFNCFTLLVRDLKNLAYPSSQLIKGCAQQLHLVSWFLIMKRDRSILGKRALLSCWFKCFQIQILS